MTRYWVGDLHLGHVKVAKIRYPELCGGMSDEEVTAHHDHVIMQQLRKLKADDQVWILGDISSGKPESEQRALELLTDVGAQLHLVSGNHDSVSGIHRNGYKQQRRWLKVFDSVQDYSRVRLHGHSVQMHHYPFAWVGDGVGRSTSRYLEWRLPDVGQLLIHAHTHATEPHMPSLYLMEGSNPPEYLEMPPRPLREGRMYCVSWDVHRGLVTEARLTEWVKEFTKKFLEV